MATSRDVAKAAGVSQSTVSRVLHDNPRVHPETRARVLAALRDASYTPHAAARAMKTGKSQTIGVVVAALNNPFYPEMLRAIGRQLQAANQHMVVWDSEGPGEISALQAIRGRSVDGVIFTTVTRQSSALREAIRQREPFVLVNRGYEGLQADQVRSDNVAGAAHIAGYLARAGRRRAAMIGGVMTTTTAFEREAGFRQGLRQNGIDLPPELYRAGDFTHDAGFVAMRDLMARARPDAVFCVNDLTAFGAIDGARSLGVQIPDDIWVIGFDDVGMAAWDVFDLTTGQQPVQEMVECAVSVLMERIDDPSRPHRQMEFPTPLVVRGSTAHFPDSPEAEG
jgi:LacI family transcriptional regulator